MTIQAILWDCDGVLIDSELLACKVVADSYTRAGYSLTASECEHDTDRSPEDVGQEFACPTQHEI